jgi:single-strand DNA-binding protein
MASLNKVLLVGNLTRDPELRATPKGNTVAQFGLAVNRTYKTDDGETRDETVFVDLEAWGRQAEAISRYLGKGSSCLVEGRLRLDTWEDKASGEKRSRLRVVAEQVQFLDRRPSEGGAVPGATDARPPSAAAPSRSGPGRPRTPGRAFAGAVAK